MARQGALSDQNATASARRLAVSEYAQLNLCRRYQWIDFVVRVVDDDWGERVLTRGLVRRRAGFVAGCFWQYFETGQLDGETVQATHRNDEQRRKQSEKP